MSITCRSNTHKRNAHMASAIVGVLATVLSFGAIACPDINSTENFYYQSDIVNASAFFAGPGKLQFTINSFDQDSDDGIPGVIELCVYPEFGRAPSGITTNPNIDPANEDLFWQDNTGNDGVFSFRRTTGDKSNVPMDGEIYFIGQATWSLPPAPSVEILLHIYNADVCPEVTGEKKDVSCWVRPQCEPNPDSLPSNTGPLLCDEDA